VSTPRTPTPTEPATARARLLGPLAVAVPLVALLALLVWQTREGLAHIDRMMEERSETLQRMVATEVRNVARYGAARLARLDDVLAEVAESRDVIGVSLERDDGSIRLAHGTLPASIPVDVAEGEGSYRLQGETILRGGPVRIDVQGCGSCRRCGGEADGAEGIPGVDQGACMGGAGAGAELAGDYQVVMALDASPYLALRRMVWFQGGAGLALVLALALALWLFQRQLGRAWGMRQALAVADERARSLERLGLMAAGLAHEIKNPVGSLRGFAQLISERTAEGSPEREYAELMVTELDAIARRVDRLRDLARPTPPRFEPASPGAIIEKVAALLQPDLAERGLKLKLELEQPGPDLEALLDADRFRDLLVNLVINAIEASPAGGTVSVRLDWQRGDDVLVLEVADEGPGIPEAERARALRPFHSTKPGGMGLGLAVAQQAVEDHGGELEIDDRPGGRKGALLRARWPRRAYAARVRA
jgi:signal transduction histidine kinase